MLACGLKCLAQTSLLAVLVSTTAWEWVLAPLFLAFQHWKGSTARFFNRSPKSDPFPFDILRFVFRCQFCCTFYIRVQGHFYLETSRRNTADSNDIVLRLRTEQLFGARAIGSLRHHRCFIMGVAGLVNRVRLPYVSQWIVSGLYITLSVLGLKTNRYAIRTTMCDQSNPPVEHGDINPSTTSVCRAIEMRIDPRSSMHSNFFYLGLLINCNISTFLSGSALIPLGLNYWQAIICMTLATTLYEILADIFLGIILGNIIATVVLIANSMAGAQYHGKYMHNSIRWRYERTLTAFSWISYS